MTRKERERAAYQERERSRRENLPQRNADGRTAKGQRALERAVRLEYEYDRDFEFETPGGRE